MGKCIGCEKKLKFLEGYKDFDSEWCENCYNNNKVILEKVKQKKLKADELRRIKELKEENNDRQINRLFKLSSESLSDRINKSKKYSKDESNEIINKYKRFRNLKISIRIVGAIVVIVSTYFYIQILVVCGGLFIIISSIVNSRYKKYLINKFSKLMS